jgi:hypothetical protein
MCPSQEQSHAQVRSSAPRVRSSALGRLGSTETLKLAYKCHSFLFYTYGDPPGVPFLVIFVFFLAFGALNSNSFVSVLILMK